MEFENCVDSIESTAKAVGESDKGIGHVRLEDDSEHRAEVHWYEATGIGRRELKVKELLD